MKVSDALLQRKSVRAFLKKDVEREKIEYILEHAKHAPSGVNMQPWNVAVLSGEAKKNLESKMEKAFREGKKEEMDYTYYPLSWEDPYKSRRKETGLMMYKTLNISREDKRKQMDQWAANYRAFDAPVVMYFFKDKLLQAGSYLDYGMFLQSVMLTATEIGLATCPQAALAEFPSIVKSELNIADDKELLCGIALGYEDKDAVINSYRTPRIEIEEFAKFYG